MILPAPTVASPHDRFVAQLDQDDGFPWTVFEIGIPMRDGIELAADVYLPKGQTGPFPTVVEATPYDKTGAFRSGDIALFTANGYAVVMADLRGRGKSEGEWRPFINDPADCHDIVEWAAAQEWSTGKIGMSGLSYLGWVQWAAASQHPPHLTAMISTSAAGRWQQEIPYTNGCFQLFFGWWVYAVRRRISESHGMSVIDWDETLRLLPLGQHRRIHQSQRSDLGGPHRARYPGRLLAIASLRRSVRHLHRSLLTCHWLVRLRGSPRGDAPLRAHDGSLSGPGTATAYRRTVESFQLPGAAPQPRRGIPLR